MVRPLYTKRLAAGIATNSSLYESGSPPINTIWDVRDIRMTQRSGSIFHGFDGFDCHIFSPPSTEYPIWAMKDVVGGTSYSWEGRQVIYPGEHLVVVTADLEWSVTVTGYELNSP
jgi:hypothetical protein